MSARRGRNTGWIGTGHPPHRSVQTKPFTACYRSRRLRQLQVVSIISLFLRSSVMLEVNSEGLYPCPRARCFAALISAENRMSMSFKLSLLVEILPQKSLFPRAELLNARLYKNVASMGIIPGRGLVNGFRCRSSINDGKIRGGKVDKRWF